MSKRWGKTDNGTEKSPPPHIWKSWQSGGATSEQKKAWWNRKRQAQELMDRILLYQRMTLEEINEIVMDAEKVKKLTAIEAATYKYVKHMLEDPLAYERWLDRHIPKAPASAATDISDQITGIEIKVAALPSHKQVSNDNTTNTDTETSWAI